MSSGNVNIAFDSMKDILSDLGLTTKQASTHWSMPKSNEDIYNILIRENLPPSGIAKAFSILTKEPFYSQDNGEFEALGDDWGICNNVLYVVNPFGSRVAEMLDARDRGHLNFLTTGVLEGVHDDGEEGEGKAANTSLLERSIDKIIINALEQGASDIHVAPRSKGHLSIMYRVDGVRTAIPHDVEMSQYKKWGNRLLMRANKMGSEPNAPISLKFSFSWNRKDIQIRMEAGPVIQGGKKHFQFVLRLLNPTGQLRQLKEVGFPKKELAIIDMLCHSPKGLVIVTGPTGSGKTTTLYAMLQRIQELRPGDAILTLEDPVEVEMAGIDQTEINDKAGMTFQAGLRSKLRLDPDVILVGELRDFETAKLAVQAAMTGHLVLATLHTNSASQSIARLIDIGVDSSTLSDSLLAITAQRMVRKVCPECCEKEEFGANETRRERYEGLRLAPSAEELISIASKAGCGKCDRGYSGRQVVSELMIIDPWTQRQILDRKPASEIESEHIKHQYASLWINGIALVRRNITTIEELEARLSPLANYGDHFTYGRETKLL